MSERSRSYQLYVSYYSDDPSPSDGDGGNQVGVGLLFLGNRQHSCSFYGFTFSWRRHIISLIDLKPAYRNRHTASLVNPNDGVLNSDEVSKIKIYIAPLKTGDRRCCVEVESVPDAAAKVAYMIVCKHWIEMKSV